MSEQNKSYRIRTNVGDGTEDYLTISTDLVQDYDTFDVLSVNIKSVDTYKLHNADYGVIVGRVLANNGFGVPNVKISIFIEADQSANKEERILYPFASSASRDKNGIRYNLLPDNKVDDCHQAVGTFPNKRYLLDNDDLIEVYDKYFKYTTRTNNSGDYLICGIPTGTHTLHMDLDLSDCGILSQKPRDFVYKGYTVEQFENPNMFKDGHEFDSLSQILSQDQIINVKPFWGNTSLGETLGITRADIKIAFKFEPTCVFMGCVTTDNASDGISRKCIPSENMGNMEELTTGEGKIEMIRKTPGGNVEEFQIKGTQLINADGVWCYQIPMNLDYLTTDEFGNMVPTDDPDKGIPTRASVRFRLSMQDNDENKDNFHRAKVLIPHNPQLKSSGHEDYDYEFGSYTKDDSFRDLFWNNVYSVKSYIPRFQKKKARGWKGDNFTGIKMCNFYGQNNPIPYNNIRIKLPLMFMIMCALLKAFIFLVSLYNRTIKSIFNGILKLANFGFAGYESIRVFLVRLAVKMRYLILMDGLCPDLDNWYFAPLGDSDNKYTCVTAGRNHEEVYYAARNTTDSIESSSMPDESDGLPKRKGFYGKCPENNDGPFPMFNYDCDDDSYTYKFTLNLLEMSLDKSLDDGEYEDQNSIDANNKDDNEDGTCITTKTDYLISCIEMALAMEYKVIKFDFYNDWINGMVYVPRWVRYIKPKSKFLGITWSREKVRGCMDNTSIFAKNRRYVQLCALGYNRNEVDGTEIYTHVKNPLTNPINNFKIRKNNKKHKKDGFKYYGIFGRENGGIVHEGSTLKKQHVYYLKPCEFSKGKKVNLYATDLILLGSLNDCDENGVPMAFKHLSSTSYLMPTNLALTNMENNGPLYGKDGGTICIGSNNEQTGIVGNNNANNPIAVVRPTLTDEAEYYKSGGFDVNSSSETNDKEMDTMPITEAAGVAWNYTGPGQGEPNPSKMYYPGGHFLGLSCVNSQSNIKSCINLSRICEVGSNMSQRKEEVRDYDENSGKFKFIYTVPSGFISGDDIVDTDFRSMFATLNSRRLIATKKNPYTGYKYYDFMFSRPINFDGSFTSVVNEIPLSEYNTGTNRGSEDESSELSQYNISSGIPGQYDFDDEEFENTQTRTREKANLYYYMFRFGLNDENNFENIGVTQQRKRFLIYKYGDDIGYLPQYENSYYFYFGLRQGSTALDEFNKQFFSECDVITLQKEASINIATSFEVCSNTGLATIITNNLETPYITISLTCKTNSNWVYEGNLEQFYNNETFTIENLPYGIYEITIIDANFNTLAREFEIGIGDVSLEFTKVDFNVNLLNGDTIPSLYDDVDRIFVGGYVNVFNIDINGMDVSEFSSVKLKLFDLDYGGYESEVVVDDFSGVYMLIPNRIEIGYRIKLEYTCVGGSPIELDMGDFSIMDNSNVKLLIGHKDGINFNCIIDNGIMEPYMEYMYKEGPESGDWWWGHDGYDISEDDENKKWLFRELFFKETKSPSSTFDSLVFAEGGEKILWGSPQNANLIRKMSACTADYGAIPHGYSLDDEYSYYPTFGVLSNTSYEEPMSATTSNSNNNMKRSNYIYKNMQYSAIACDFEDNKVCGDFFLIYDRNSTPKIQQVGHNGVNYFQKGNGCVFKPMPYGELVFLFYDESDDYLNMITKIENNAVNCDYGVIYPTFIYPVMRRQFFVNMDMFEWSKSVINEYDDGGGITYLDYGNEEYGLKVEGKLNNGVTVKQSGDSKHRFNESSKMVTVGDFYNEICTSDDDLTNLLYKEPTNRIIEFSGYTNEITSGLDIGYRVIEGSVDGGFDEYVHEINYSFNGGFADRINITCSGPDFMEPVINNIYPIGGEDDSIKYYLCKYSSFDAEFITSGDTTYVRSGSGDLYRVLCRFDKYDESNPQIKEETRGQYVIVSLKKRTILGSSSYHIAFNYITTDGVESEFTEELNLGQHGCSWNYIDDLISKLGNGMGNFKYPIIPVENKTVVVNPKISGETVSWKNFIDRIRQNRGMYNEQMIANNGLSFDKSEIVFGLGIKTDSAVNGGVTRINKIYPYLYDVTGYGEEWGDSNKSLWVSDSALTCEAKHSTIGYSISASSPCMVSLQNLGDWISSNDGLVINIKDPIIYNLSIDALHNNDSASSRSNVITLTSGISSKTIELTQSAAVLPNVILKIWVKTRTDSNYVVLNNGEHVYYRYGWIEYKLIGADSEAYADFNVSGEFTFMTEDGDNIWYQSSSTFMFNAQGNNAATSELKTHNVFSVVSGEFYGGISTEIKDSNLNNYIKVEVL